MASRVLIGQHPDGAMGLFISKAGVNVTDVGSGDSNNLLFSSQWSQSLNIVQSGTCSLEQEVWFTDLGYLPFIRFDQVNGTFVDTSPVYGDQKVLTDEVDRFRTMTRFTLDFLSGNSFYIRRKFPDTDAGIMGEGSYFRYVVFNVPVQ